MSLRYQRVMPRDLFNEACLMKCMGKVALLIMGHPNLHMRYPDREPFLSSQDPGDGAIALVNVKLYCKDTHIPLHRPLNSREAWPLMAFDSIDEQDIEVFTREGVFSEQFLQLVDVLQSENQDWERPDDALP